MGTSNQGRLLNAAAPRESVLAQTAVYVGPVFDQTGYGLAARYNAAALALKDPALRVQEFSFGQRVNGDDRVLRLVRQRLAKDRSLMFRAPVRIVHAPPRDFAALHSTQAYCIGCTVWETDRLTSEWVRNCNRMNEVWVPCRDNVEWFRASGVTVPMYVVPHIAPDLPGESRMPEPFRFLSTEQRVVFYSIFVWQERKNPLGTLAAYLAEFTGKDRVLLVVKVSGNVEQAQREIADLRQTMNLEDPPDVRVIDGNFTDAEMAWLHQRGDCYYQLQHSEGWGLPHFEALAHGNTLITTAFGGPRDFMQPEFVKQGAAYPISGFLTPVRQAYRYYSGRQRWLEPNVEEARRALRAVAQAGKRKHPMVAEAVRHEYSMEAVGNIMRDRLTTVFSQLASK